MNKEHLKKIRDYFFNILDLLIFVIILYILLESIKFGSFINCVESIIRILKTGSRYIFTTFLIFLGIILIIRSLTKNNFICKVICSIILLCITLVSYYKYVALEQPFVPYDILLAGNLNQISEFGFTGITMQMFFSVVLLVVFLIIAYFMDKIVSNKIKLTPIKRIITFMIGIIIVSITCVSPNRYKKFNIKNDNGDNYAWMGANAVFFMHLGDFYNPKPVRI